MTPSRDDIEVVVSLYWRDANTLEVCIDFPITSGLFSSAKSFPSLSQLAFGPGNTVDPHLPICLSVASFHQKDREREIGKGKQGRK